ncbi:MAG: peptidase M17 [Bacteroidota bacterium]
MNTQVLLTDKISKGGNILLVAEKKTSFEKFGLSKAEIKYVKESLEHKKDKIFINRLDSLLFIFVPEKKSKEERPALLEKYRRAGDHFGVALNKHKMKSVCIADAINDTEALIALAEGMVLGNYQFLKYKEKADEKKNSLKEIKIVAEKKYAVALEQMLATSEGTLLARTWINEPPCTMTATQFSSEVSKLGKQCGFHVDVLTKAKIHSLKFTGLINVNKGSNNPPTFNILEWKPKKYSNKKPYVLVGKGVMMDTGGVNVKPGAFMDFMKSDMSGAAAVAGAFVAIAKAKLPVHVIGLIPCTDNMPDGKAYVSGDVLSMHNGVTVEIFSTDAEGRLILSDALSYAKQYKPELVIDIATLTGAASQAIGRGGMVGMGTAPKSVMEKLKDCGLQVHERIAEFPFWDDYEDSIKSEIADIKNIGGSQAGAITAGKFLAHFIDYPWIHLDIAGPAFIESKDGYRTFGGTGVGVRLFFEFLKNIK